MVFIVDWESFNWRKKNQVWIPRQKRSFFWFNFSKGPIEEYLYVLILEFKF